MKTEINLPDLGPIEIRRRRGMRHLSLRVAPGRGAWLNLPYGISLRHAEAFLQSQRSWLTDAIRHAREREQQTAIPTSIGSEYRTRHHLFRILSTDAPHPHHHIDGATVSLYLPPHLSPDEAHTLARRTLLLIYRTECTQHLPARVRHLAALHGFQFNRLTFRDNVSRWGSCSSRGTISLNVRLAILPDHLVDYVILHELCHTVHPDHSPRFWALLQRVCPNALEARAQLRHYNTIDLTIHQPT